MINHVPELMRIMHEFTPEGQTILLNALRKNRAVVNKKFGFARELPSILIKDGTMEELQKAYKKNEYIECLVDDLLVKGLEIDVKDKFWQKCCVKYHNLLEEASSKNHSLIHDLSDNFESKRAKIIEYFKTRGFFARAKQAKNAKNPEELSKVVYDGNMSINDTNTHNNLKLIKQSGIRNNRNGFSLESLREIMKNNGKLGDNLLELQKIVGIPPADPELIRLINIIKQEFGMDYVHFKSVDEAVKFLRAARIAKIEGVPIAKNVATSNIMPGFAAGANCHNSNFGNIVFLKPEEDVELMNKEIIECRKQIKHRKFRRYLKLADEVNEQFGFNNENPYSTQSELHAQMHELIHSEVIGKHFSSYATRKLSKEQIKVAEKVSNYAAASARGMTEEVRTELRARQILSKYFPKEVPELTPEQTNLLDFWS